MTIITERIQSVDSTTGIDSMDNIEDLSKNSAQPTSSPSLCRVSLMALATILMLSGCHMTPSTMHTDGHTYQQTSPSATSLQLPITQVVSGDYAKRELGFNEVVVKIRPRLTDEISHTKSTALNSTALKSPEQIAINIRARHNGTNASAENVNCHFDGIATLMGQDGAHGVIFETVAHGSVTFLQFKHGRLTIDAQNPQALSRSCSGGATLAGEYQKLR